MPEARDLVPQLAHLAGPRALLEGEEHGPRELLRLARLVAQQLEEVLDQGLEVLQPLGQGGEP